MQRPLVSNMIAQHPDMQIHPLRRDLAIVSPACYEFYRKQLPDSIELIMGEKDVTGTYPSDCAYNVARFHQFVFCNTKYTSRKLLDYYRGENMQIIHINQGYAKCNMAFLGEDCIITEDAGIHKTIIVNKLPMHSILVNQGEISLKGFPYGFIGGACGGDETQLFWYGNPEFCSYYPVLKKEAEKRRVEIIALEEKPPEDLGGIICFPM